MLSSTNSSRPLRVQSWSPSTSARSHVVCFSGKYSPHLARVDAEHVDLLILGDLHINQDIRPFHVAREQLKVGFGTIYTVREALSTDSRSFVVQLGDLGTGATSGTETAFNVARDYLEGFECPYHIVLGNHDLEGPNYDTDEENLTAWQNSFQHHHHWVRDVGPAVLVGISTTRYRCNAVSHHEVYIDQSQRQWLWSILRDFEPHKPIILFSHAPPMGCGLKVLNAIHVKNRCAWLNHSENPEEFMQMAQSHPRIRGWFSGHFHLSQNYDDSIVVSGGCAFVQTGVIGPASSRDGNRQSRLLRLSPKGYTVSTVDHERDGEVRDDLIVSWNEPESPQIRFANSDTACAAEGEFLRAVNACSVIWHDSIRWWPTGFRTMLALQDNMLVEYDTATFAPSGCVTLNVGDAEVKLKDWRGRDVTDNVPGSGEDVNRIELWDTQLQKLIRAFGRNDQNSFFQVYQPNKWRIKQARSGNLV